MKIDMQDKENVKVVRFEGKLDTNTTPEAVSIVGGSGSARGSKRMPSQAAARRKGFLLGHFPAIQIGTRGCWTGRGLKTVRPTW